VHLNVGDIVSLLSQMLEGPPQIDHV